MFREFVAYRRMVERDRERHLSMVWIAADLNARASVGKLPNLQEFLKKCKGVTHQTRSEQASIMAQLSARLGVPMKRTRLIRKAS